MEKVKNNEIDAAIKAALFTSKRAFDSAYAAYVIYRKRSARNQENAALQRRIWREELVNLKRLNALTQVNPFDNLEGD